MPASALASSPQAVTMRRTNSVPSIALAHERPHGSTPSQQRLKLHGGLRSPTPMMRSPARSAPNSTSARRKTVHAGAFSSRQAFTDVQLSLDDFVKDSHLHSIFLQYLSANDKKDFARLLFLYVRGDRIDTL
jgi:hypothetical protein